MNEELKKACSHLINIWFVYGKGCITDGVVSLPHMNMSTGEDACDFLESLGLAKDQGWQCELTESGLELFDKDYITKGGTRFTAFMSNHIKIYEYYLNKFNIQKEIVFVPHSGTVEQIIEVLKTGEAVEVSWMPTPHGHYSPIVGYSELRKAFKVADPYKRFDFKTKKYTNESGLNAWYPIADMLPYLEKSALVASDKKFKGIRFCYLRKK